MKKLLCAITALLLLFLVSGCAPAGGKGPVHLVWWLMTPSEAPVDWQEVEDALNAYSEEKIGVTCDFRYYDSNQIALVSQTGEYFDIAFTSDYWNDFGTSVSVGMFRDLKDDLDDYPALKASVLENTWDSVKVGDGLYAIPHMKDIAYEVFWILDTEYFDGKGFPGRQRSPLRKLSRIWKRINRITRRIIPSRFPTAA